MKDSKFFLESRSVWGILIMFAAEFADKQGWGWFGLVEPHLVPIVNDLVFAGGGYWATKGTLFRDKKLSLKPVKSDKDDEVAAEAKRLFNETLSEVQAKVKQ